MSVFSPVDVVGPANRRKQLISKLMQQQGSAHPAASALATANDPFGAPGQRIGGGPQFVGPSNVFSNVMAQLGVQGFGNDAYYSPNPQGGGGLYGSGHYVSPHEVSGSGPGVIPANSGGVSAPAPGGGSAASYSPSQTPNAYNPVQANSPGTGGGYTLPAWQNFNPNFVPLGGGFNYDPHLGMVIPGLGHH